MCRERGLSEDAPLRRFQIIDLEDLPRRDVGGRRFVAVNDKERRYAEIYTRHSMHEKPDCAVFLDRERVRAQNGYPGKSVPCDSMSAQCFEM